jgi:hypothetical protein
VGNDLPISLLPQYDSSAAQTSTVAVSEAGAIAVVVDEALYCTLGQ